PAHSVVGTHGPQPECEPPQTQPPDRLPTSRPEPPCKVEGDLHSAGRGSPESQPPAQSLSKTPPYAPQPASSVQNRTPDEPRRVTHWESLLAWSLYLGVALSQ